MLGSLMMFASGLLAEFGELGDSSRLFARNGEDAAGEGNVAQLDLDPRWLRERLDDRQQRIGREQRSFVRVRVDNLHCSPPGVLANLFLLMSRYLMCARTGA